MESAVLRQMPDEDIVYSPTEISGNRGYSGDRSKGIISKPMPREWYDRHSVNQIEDPEQRAFYQKLTASKKPYFMRYIYPTLASQYNTYISNTNKKAIREFRITMDELLAKDEQDLTDTEREFIRYYHIKMPVGMHDCIMNRICRRFEQEFDNYISKRDTDQVFDYSILKGNHEYTTTQFNSISSLHKSYTKRVQSYMQFAKAERLDEDECAEQRAIMIQEFQSACQAVCSNESQLCDILLDICYQKEGSKQFAWDIVGEEIIHNLLAKNGNRISYPVVDGAGDVIFGGERFSFHTKELEVTADEHCIE